MSPTSARRVCASAAAMIMLLCPTAAPAGGVIPRCIEILKEYVGKPAVKGASEALGTYLMNTLMQKATSALDSPGALPETAPAIPAPEALMPGPELSMSYFDYLQSLGLNECEIRNAMERAYGPPPAKRYNPD